MDPISPTGAVSSIRAALQVLAVGCTPVDAARHSLTFKRHELAQQRKQCQSILSQTQDNRLSSGATQEVEYESHKKCSFSCENSFKYVYRVNLSLHLTKN